MTPSFLVMNWRYPDAILNSSFFSVPGDQHEQRQHR